MTLLAKSGFPKLSQVTPLGDITEIKEAVSSKGVTGGFEVIN